MPKIEHPITKRVPRDESTPDRKADWQKIHRAALAQSPSSNQGKTNGY